MKNRKKTRKWKTGICLLILCAAVGLVSTVSLPALAETTTETVSNEGEFMAALKNSGVDTIKLSGSIQIGTDNGGDDPLIIDRKLTLEGGELSLRKAGIILGADVVFKEIKIGFANPVRNAIIANGHSLTLENVTQSGTYEVHLFAGGISDYSSQGTVSVPASGTAGKIRILGGSNKLGDIFAGSFSDGADEMKAGANDFSGTCEIRIESSAGGTLGDIYAHGAREARGDSDGNLLYPDADKYKVSGGVTIHLNNTLVKRVYGNTGESTDASVVYTDNGKGNAYPVLLEAVGSLSLLPKTGKAHMILDEGSSISDLSLPPNTLLDLNKLGAMVVASSLKEGGGTLILRKDQSLGFSGEVKGKTFLAIGGLTADGSSLQSAENGRTYLKASSSANDSFALLQDSVQSGTTLVRDKEGNWSAVSGDQESIVIESMSMEDLSIEKGSLEVRIPVKIKYASLDTYDSLGFVPMSVTVGNMEADRKEDSGSYVYSTGQGSQDMEFYFTVSSEDGSEILYLKGIGNNPIKEGVHRLRFTIPGQYMKSGIVSSTELKLTVGSKQEEDSLPKDTITLALESISRSYDGNSFSLSPNKGTHFSWKGNGAASIEEYYLDQTGTKTTPENSGSSASGKAPVNAGTYYAKVSVASDGTYGKTTALIPFTITRANLEVQSLPVVSPLSPGGALSQTKIQNGVVVIKGTNTAVNGTWMWVDGTIKPTSSGSFNAKFHPTASNNFHDLGERQLLVTVSQNLKAFMISFKSGEGSGQMANGTAIEGTEFTLPASGFTPPAGKKFSGWRIDQKEYKAGDKLIFTRNTEVIAIWIKADGSTGQGTQNTTSGTSGNTNSGSANYPGTSSTAGSSAAAQTSGGMSVYGTKNTVKPSASVSGSSVVVGVLNQNQVQQLLSEHTERNPITFDVSSMGKGINMLTLSRENLRVFAESAANGGLRINFASGTVTLDAKALKAIVAQSDGENLNVVFNNAGTAVLNEKQIRSTQNLQLHGAAEIYFLSVKDNRRISDLQGGVMTVSMPFSIPSGHSSAKFIVWYIDGNGDRTKLTSWYEGYKIHWQVGHNSAFIITYQDAATAAATTAATTATTAVTAAPNTVIKSPKTGDTRLDTVENGLSFWESGGWAIPFVVILTAAFAVAKRKKNG